MSVITPPQKNNLSNAYKIYFEQKQLALILEKSNDSKLILFPSVSTKGAKDEWLKLGGNSALFYKYLIAPRLGKKSPTIRPDTDTNHRFKNGIISIHWKNIFLENMQKLNLIAKEQSGLLIVDLNFHYTAQEIHKLANQEKAERTKINQVLQPKSPHPQLYGLFLNLARILPVKVHKMEISYRQTFGINLNQSLTAIFKIYTRTANGLLPQSVAKQKLLELIDDISAVLIILNEIKALDVSTESRLGILISDIRITIEKDLK